MTDTPQRFAEAILNQTADYLIVRCGRCAGTGTRDRDGRDPTCAVCDGSGRLRVNLSSPHGEYICCMFCKGDGTRDRDHLDPVCPVCKGVGGIYCDMPRVMCARCQGTGSRDRDGKLPICAACHGLGFLLEKDLKIVESTNLERKKPVSGPATELVAHSRESTVGGSPKIAEFLDCTVFISYAHEQQDFVRRLAIEIKKRGISVWLDELALKLGDSLRRSIDKGLSHAAFGVVVLSREFFAKEWPQRELDSLVAKEIDRKVILPIWYDLTLAEVRKLAPLLADRIAAKSSEKIESIADKIAEVVGK